MNKQQLQAILSSPYDQAVWKHVLIEVFGVKRILKTPQPIYLSNTQKASEAYELGSFSTKDDRIIGIYQVNVHPEVWLERNKVGLRTLLRDVYKYDVDGAIIVFVQENKWRLSFVSEIKTLNEKGEIQTQATEPRRYTYLLGEGEKVLTPAQNLAKIAGKPITLEDIRNTFSVEALNEEFYKIIAQQFYELVGATAGKGKNIRTYERKLQLPSTSDAKTYQEFAVRLIGRTIFCWFLKVKKSDSGLSLLPEHLLGSAAVSQFSNYYHTVLERIFFQTLNTPMEKRLSDLPTGANQIPFLNGGLFDYQEDDFYIPNRITGLSENINTLIVPDQWFLSFFQELEKYNFTIDENSTVDIEVSVDPEMLGRIFESLLAEIDPDSGETARKATGSFYTPREIVDYMATESLVHYLHNKTAIEKESLSMLFKIDSQIREDSVLITQKIAILEALDTLKILDPACGSGAFPMGVLQKIVMALQKIDPNSVWWKNQQIEKNDNPVVKSAVRKKLNAASVEYARKIGIIQNTLYGVDIQPIAAEISKLRCFLTLIVDENIDENKPNRGVEPLPNLEFKFVTADSLRKLPLETNYGGLFNANDDLEQLKRIRQDYLQSFGDAKATLKTKFKEIQDRVAQQQFSLGKNIDTNSRAYLIGTWKPFSHEKVDWFDPEWMFGFEKFDIVIGNPPYDVLDNKEKTKELESLFKIPIYKKAKGGKINLYKLFLARCADVVNNKGVICQIFQNSFLADNSAKMIRQFYLTEQKIIHIDSFPERDNVNKRVFKSAKMSVCILLSENNRAQTYNFQFCVWSDRNRVNGKKITYSNQEVILFDKDNFSILPLNQKDKEIIYKIHKLPKLSEIGNCWTGEIDLTIQKPYLRNPSDQFKKMIKGAAVQKWEIRDKMSQGEVQYLDAQIYLIENNGKKSRHHEKERIVMQGITGVDERYRLKMAYLEAGIFCGNSVNYILLEKEEYSSKYILALMNSTLLNWYFKIFSTNSNVNGYEVNNLPIVQMPPVGQIPFIILVDYLLFLKTLGKESSINEYVPNSHIVQLFEEVIDGMIYELYFKEDFEAANIEFIRYAERDFRSIEGIDDESEKITIIHKSYQKLREKDNEIRNNLKLMLIELKDLLTPIITAK